MKKYQTVVGQHDFRPRDWPKICRGNFYIKLLLRFGIDCNYTLINHQKSWAIKCGGFSDQIFVNDHNSAMVAGRYDPNKPGRMDLIGYFNYNDTDIYTGQVVSVPMYTDTLAYVVKDKSNRKHKVFIQDPSSGTWYKYEQKAYLNRYFAKYIGMWFGAQPPAPKVMTVWQEHTFIRGKFDLNLIS